MSPRDAPPVKHVLFLLQFGSEVRQFGHSGFIDLLLQERCHVTIAAREWSADLQGQFSDGVQWVRLPRPASSVAYEQLASALDQAQALRRKKLGLSTWAYGRSLSKNIRQRARRAAVRAAASCLTSPSAGRAAEAMEARISRRLGARSFGAFLDGLRPDAVVVSSPRVNYQAQVLSAAADRGAARVLFYHSNKDVVALGRLDHRYSAIGVWNAWMKEQLLQANPACGPDSIDITGCGHFDPLAREQIAAHGRTVRERLGVAPAERIVLYTAAGPGAVPEEERYIFAVLDAVESLGESGVRLVVRLNPMDVTGRIGSILETRRPRIVVTQPDWHYSPVANLCYQRRGDTVMLGGLLSEAAVCVNIPSTVTTECALAGTPVVNIGFDLPGPAPLPGSIRAFWDVDYYANARRARAALLADGPEELASCLRASLLDRNRLQAGQQHLLDLELGGVRPPHASHRYLEVLRR